MANNANDVLAMARKDVGYSRWTDPQQGTKFGRWYSRSHGSYYGTNGVPYCAMAVSYWFAMAGATCPGLPEAYCPYILNKARSAGAVLSNKKKAQPGDVVLFNWDGGVVDHVGIVEKNYGSYIQTIEGNTSSGSGGSQSNGGGVYRRTRSWGVVAAIVRPSWGSASGGGSSSSSGGKLTVDGYLGPNSIREWQIQIGSQYIDGVISGQHTIDKKHLANIVSITWEGNGQSSFAKKLQRFLCNKGYKIAVDGYLGYNTVIALQKFLRDYCGYKRHGIDGYLGPNTAANVQNALNAGMFK